MSKNLRLFLFLLLSSTTLAQWQQVSTGLWPDNTNFFMRQIKAIHNHNGTLFVANTYGNLAKSTDDGANWITFYPSNFPMDTYITSFETLGSRLFVGVQNSDSLWGVYYSDDDGATFISANSTLPAPTSIRSLDTRDGKVYAGGGGAFAGSMFISSDQGATWVNKSNGISQLAGVTCVTFDDAGNIYAGASNARVYKSTNDGEEWISASTGLPNSGGVSSIIYFNGNLAASVGNNNAIHYSSDGGQSWNPVTGFSNANHNYSADFILIGPDIWAATPFGSFKSTDNGATWSQDSPGLSNNTLCFAIKDNYLFAGAASSGVYKRETGAVSVDDEINVFSYKLSQNYPNPFNPSTKIEFIIPQNDFVTLKIYNSLGEEIATLINNEISSGKHSVNFDASQLSSGVYYYKIQAGNFLETKKMILIR